MWLAIELTHHRFFRLFEREVDHGVGRIPPPLQLLLKPGTRDPFRDVAQEWQIFDKEGPRGHARGDPFHRCFNCVHYLVASLGYLDAVNSLEHTRCERAKRPKITSQ